LLPQKRYIFNGKIKRRSLLQQRKEMKMGKEKESISNVIIFYQNDQLPAHIVRH